MTQWKYFLFVKKWHFPKEIQPIPPKKVEKYTGVLYLDLDSGKDSHEAWIK